jgi:hypothetical protein
VRSEFLKCFIKKAEVHTTICCPTRELVARWIVTAVHQMDHGKNQELLEDGRI